ncbi:MAG: hypothetical protein A2161_22460 [Candidatus Schekmanbacteria bacterium RBG_13_48_7]|uniref:Glycosyltransferase 2-like domain-containing protein n=1 Tax=Candidatus Schekmanbacteria bacterium RBG_13_48_7 TaxID=1817878 RepID=A0A1F7RI96_9BACT|nr:MAG: hypothetical protein A2161_22460 [Candidatus Schekmanbacteria bacterium RBG_13_48_7]
MGTPEINNKNREIIFSVIVTTHNRNKPLDRCLENLLQLDFDIKKYEIIIVFDGCDSTETILQNQSLATTSSIKRLPVPHKKGPAHGRNLGAAQANGNILVFIDDDCIPCHDWLSNLRDEIDHNPDTPGIFGLIKSDHPIVFPFIHSIQNDKSGPKASCNLALRKDAFVKTGGFDEQFKNAGYEDTDLILRIEKKIGSISFSSLAVVTHISRYVSFRSQVKRLALAESKMLFRKKHPDSNTGKGQLLVLRNCILKIYHFWFFLLLPFNPSLYIRFLTALAIIMGFRMYNLHKLSKVVSLEKYRIPVADRLLFVSIGWLNDFIELFYIVKGFIRFYLKPNFCKDE